MSHLAPIPPPASHPLQIWPIKVLKVAVSFFFEIFYIGTLGIFCVSFDCTYYRSGPKKSEVRGRRGRVPEELMCC